MVLTSWLSIFADQSLLWMEPDHPIVVLRLAGVFLCALPAVRELFQYINDPRYSFSFLDNISGLTCYSRRAVRMGQHVWLLLATIVTELLVITKWSRGQFTEPLPTHIKWSWIAGGMILVVYPIVRVSGHIWCGRNSLPMVAFALRQFGIPSTKRYLRKHKKAKSKVK